MTDNQTTLFGVRVIENEVVDEGAIIVSDDGQWVAMHPVSVIRLKMWQADPWEVFDAITEWRLQHALADFALREQRRAVAVADVARHFLLEVGLHGMLVSLRLERIYA